MALPSNGLILDAPCGFGRNALWLAEQGYEVVAVDRNAGRLNFLEEAKARLGSGRIHSVCADLETSSWPFRHYRFSAVVCIHYPIQGVLSNFDLVLENRGMLYIETFGGQGKNYLQLPKAGEAREALKGYNLHLYKERPVGPSSHGSVALTLLAEKVHS
jgi:SAM-dependent methyltransferase